MESRQYTRHLSLSERNGLLSGRFLFQHSNSHRELISAFRYIATGGPVVYHLEIQRHSSVSVYAAQDDVNRNRVAGRASGYPLRCA